jgi:hypothetical protein
MYVESFLKLVCCITGNLAWALVPEEHAIKPITAAALNQLFITRYFLQ